MVKKLFKHEIKAYLRTIIPMHLILIAVALLSRIIQIFDDNSDTFNTVFGSSVIVFVIGAIVCLVLTFIFGIKRFYSNMFTYEGYLTLTLPVTSTAHIFVKAVIATLSAITSFIMIAISVCVITFGDVCVELFNAAGWILKMFYKELGFNSVFYIIECVVLYILSIMMGYLLLYACIAIGQRAKKNRVAAAVGVYFAYYFIVQILGTCLIVIINNYYMYLPIENIIKFIENNPEATVHIFLCAAILWQAILGTIYFIVTRYTINKKLNLE